MATSDASEVLTSSDGCGCCGCSPCTIAVCVDNCNAITDDDFAISLNGTGIATLIETNAACSFPFGPCRGHLITDTSCAGTSYIVTSGCGGFLCGCCGTPLSLTYHTATLNQSCEDFPTLTFRLQSTSNNNNCGNFGLFRVGGICNCGTLTWTYTAAYGGDSGLLDNTFVVPNPCCSSFGTIVNGFGPARAHVNPGDEPSPQGPTGSPAPSQNPSSFSSTSIEQSSVEQSSVLFTGKGEQALKGMTKEEFDAKQAARAERKANSLRARAVNQPKAPCKGCQQRAIEAGKANQ